MAGHLLAAGRHVAELEQVGHPPVARLQLGVALAGRARGGDHVGGGGEPLLDAVRAPERDVAGVERRGERARVARGARRRDRLGAQRLRARAVGRVVELDGEARLQARAQHAVIDGLERLLEPGDRLGVEVDDGDPEPGEPERRLAEQLRRRRGGARARRRR